MARVKFNDPVQDTAGNALSGASVQIDNRAGGAATLYAAATGATTVGNPRTTGTDGLPDFWLEEGSYTATSTKSGYTFEPFYFEAVTSKQVATSVKDHPYNAVGNGSTDDTTAIQTALTDVRTAGGGVVYFPPGTYRVTSDLTVGSKTKMLGAGSGASFIRRDSTTGLVAIVKNYNVTAGPPITSTDTDIEIEGLKIERQGTYTASPGWPYDNVIQLRGVTRAAVRDCHILGAAAESVFLEGCTYWEVSGNRVDGFFDVGIAGAWNGALQDGYGVVTNNRLGVPSDSFSSAIIVTQRGCEVSNNVMKDCGTNFIEANTADGLVVAGNVARYSGSGTVNNSIFVVASTGVAIVGNRIDKGSIKATYYSGGEATQFCDELLVSGNVVGDGDISIANSRGFTVVGNRVIRGVVVVSPPATGTATDGLIHGNSQGHAQTRGFWLTGTNVKRVRLTDNVARNNNQSAGAGDAGSGLLVDGCDEVQVVGNRAYDGQAVKTQQYGLYVNAGTNLIDRDNDFRGNGTGERATFSGTPTWADRGQVTGAFRAYFSGSPGALAANAVMPFDAEDWDVSGWLDTVTNKGRFTPQVPGYYRLSAAVQMSPANNDEYVNPSIYKNGAAHSVGALVYQRIAATGLRATVSDVVLFNGTTDYADIRVGHNAAAGSLTPSATKTVTYFSGELVGRGL